MHATWPDHPILTDFITLIASSVKYKSLSSALWSFLQPSLTSSLLDASILFSALVTNIHNINFFLRAKDKVWHPFKAKVPKTEGVTTKKEHVQWTEYGHKSYFFFQLTDPIMVLQILIFILIDAYHYYSKNNIV